MENDVKIHGWLWATEGRHADVTDWGHIVQIACGANSCFGLRDDGKVVAAGLNDYGICDVQYWTEMRIPE